MNPLASAVSRISVGIDVSVHNLTMFPLLNGVQAEESFYLTLDEALGQGWAHVTEVSEQGSVPELRFLNNGSKPVLILDGEELIGAKQNRVVNLSILAPAKSKLTIPVSCVEAGRWRTRTTAFAAAPRAQYAEGRARKMAQVTRSLHERGERMADQSDVWAGIAAKSARLSATSTTGAMEAMFMHHAASLEDFVGAIAPVDGQTGALFVVEDRIVGFDLFDCAPTFRKLLPKLVRSYALDAIDRGGASRERVRGSRGHRAQSCSLRTAVNKFLADVIRLEPQRVKAIGLGDDVRVNGKGVAAAALVHEEHVVHLAAFAA
jgi:hypothetical protein